MQICINELITDEAKAAIEECKWTNQVYLDESLKPEYEIIGEVYCGSEHFCAQIIHVFRYNGELVGIRVDESSEETFGPNLGEMVELIPMEETVSYKVK